jgi:hypothetical protein
MKLPLLQAGLLIALLAACPVGPSGSTTGGSGSSSGVILPVTCAASAPAATLYSGECNPAQNTTFCLFTQNTGF